MTQKITTDKADKKAILLRIPYDLAKAMKILAAKTDKTFQDLAIEAFQDVLKKHGEKVHKD
jgi:hypothetical protein